MIYLFNSGSKNKYVRNVLNTLYLPNGCINEYRYSIGTNLPVNSIDVFHNTTEKDVLIIFIDRYNVEKVNDLETGKYIYHPLRLGKYLGCYKKDNRLFFQVKLEDFIYPHDINGFNTLIQNELKNDNLPKFTKDKNNPNDGFYAIEKKGTIIIKSEYCLGEDSWQKIVNNISHLEAFDEPVKNSYPIFIRGKIINEYNNSVEHYKDSEKYKLIRSDKYKLDMSYYFPIQDKNKKITSSIKFIVNENLKSLNKDTLNIDTNSNSIYYEFSSRKYLEDTNGLICIENNPNNEFNIFATDSEIKFEIKDSISFWWKLFLSFIFFAGSSILIGNDNIYWQLAGGVFQAFSLFGVFKLVGKKIM